MCVILIKRHAHKASKIKVDLVFAPSIIYLPRVLCLSVCDSVYVCVCVCVCVTIAERPAILLVLVIKLTKEMRRRAWRGRD